jgi:uncharacterized protein YodC (DUF2158 family)
VGTVTPALAQPPINAGSGFTNFTVQNLDTANAANVVAEYVDKNGNVAARVPTANFRSIPAGSAAGFPAADSGLPAGFEGSAIVSGDRALGAFVQMFFQGGNIGTTLGAYEAFRQGAQKLFFPSLFSRAGKQVSLITVQSAESPSTTAEIEFTIRFFNRDGVEVQVLSGQKIKKGTQQTFALVDRNLPANAPDGFIGSATVESTSPLAGVAVTHWSDGYSASYSALTEAQAGTRAFLPSVTRRLPGGPFEQFTGVNVQNLDATNAANITVRWYNRLGQELHSFNDTIPANSAKGYNTQFAANTPNANALFQALGTDLNGSVVIESTNGRNIVAIANLQWTAISGPGLSGTAYASASAGTAEIFIPGTFRRAAGANWLQCTGAIVQNVGAAACNNFNVKWFDRDGVERLNYNDSLNPNISHGYNTRVASDLQPLGNPENLGNDFRGSVVINAPGCSLGAIHNTLFPEWGESSTYNAFGR